jgi:glycine cleavage system regulatory protein
MALVLILCHIINQVTNVFHFHSISSYDLKGEIQNMQMQSTGLDKISTKLIKQTGDTITESLLEVFNESLLEVNISR